MNNSIKISLFLLLFFISCYNEDEFLPSELSNIINIKVENNNLLADGKSIVKVIAKFPPNFKTEDDNKVKFIISGMNTKEVNEDIRLVEENGINMKIAELLISTKFIDSINVKAVISVKKVEISKGVEISFKRAFCESINISSSALTIKPDSSFSEITINTNLIRNVGSVSVGTEAETKIVDINGRSRGIFVDYKSKTDSTGAIKNKFTMGNDPYEGRLFVISESLAEKNSIKKDTLIIYSQK